MISDDNEHLPEPDADQGDQPDLPDDHPRKVGHQPGEQRPRITVVIHDILVDPRAARVASRG
jgi:hypothetical protein